MMWQAITFVSSGVTLPAFVTAAIAWLYASKACERERLIRTADGDSRFKLAKVALDLINVSTNELTKQQRYELALKLIHARAERFRTTAVVVCFLAVVAAVTTTYAIGKSVEPSEPRPEVNSVSPTSVRYGIPTWVTLNGKGFQPGFRCGWRCADPRE